MEQVKEKKLNLFDVLFGKNEYVTSDDTYTTYVESSYIKSLKKEAEGAINKEKEKNKSSKNGGGFINIKDLYSTIGINGLKVLGLIA